MLRNRTAECCPRAVLIAGLIIFAVSAGIISGAAILSVDVTNVTRTVWAGQNVSSNSFQVWESSSSNLTLFFTNTITYTNSGTWTNWLSVSPSNDVSHGELKTVWMTFDTASLPVSNQAYGATIYINASDDAGATASNSPFALNVSVLVQGVPKLGVSPAGLTNSVTVGYRPAIQYISVANTGDAPRASMAYIVSSNASWISISQDHGDVTDGTNTIALNYLTENLPAGVRTGIVTVTASGIATQDVPVVLTVNNPPALSWNATQQTWTNEISAGQTISSFTFDAWNGSAAPTGTLRFALSHSASWLSFSPPNGTSSGERQSISVIYAVSNLAIGVYTGLVTFSGTDDSTGETVSNSPLTIATRLTVRGLAALSVDVDSLTNALLENCETTSATAFKIWNSADVPRGGLNYSITPSVSWLSVSPSSGIITNATNAIAVTWSPGTRAPGTYSGSIVVDGTDQLTGSRATGAPKTISVQMTVLLRTPVNYEKPTISYGAPYIGQTLSARNGLWQNMDRLTFTYQWQKADNAAGAGIVDLAGETTSNHMVVAAEKGKYMRIAVTATDANPTPLTVTAYSDLVIKSKIKAAPGDFNSDGITDLWFFDQLTGIWRASFAAHTFAEGEFGSAGMTPVPADYNGDGILDLGLYDSAHGMWYILYLPSGPSVSGSMFGGTTEEAEATPVPNDYDGDGQADIAIYWRGYWAILYSTINSIIITPPIAGANGSPAPSDYDGDGITDLGVYDSGLWTTLDALGQTWSVSFGSAAWLPAPDDYDGDNIADLAIFSQTTNQWQILSSLFGTTNTKSFGSSTGANLPRQGYYDHDPYCDPATIQYSADGDFMIWCVTRTANTNLTYRGQSYQKSEDTWRVSW